VELGEAFEMVRRAAPRSGVAADNLKTNLKKPKLQNCETAKFENCETVKL
jgi:hypothetical protein